MTEIFWVQPVLKELGINQTTTVILWCDNLGATYLCANPTFHTRMKHVELNYHFLQERVARGLIDIGFISANDEVADGFTNDLSACQLENL
jgi:pyocin large subunit-like protein